MRRQTESQVAAKRDAAFKAILRQAIPVNREWAAWGQRFRGILNETAELVAEHRRLEKLSAGLQREARRVTVKNRNGNSPLQAEGLPDYREVVELLGQRWRVIGTTVFLAGVAAPAFGMLCQAVDIRIRGEALAAKALKKSPKSLGANDGRAVGAVAGAPLLPPPPDRGPLLTAQQVAKIVGGVSTAWVKRTVPVKVRLGHSTVRWYESDVRAWLESQRTGEATI